MEDKELFEISEQTRLELAAKLTLDFLNNLKTVDCLETAIANTVLSTLELGCKLGNEGYIIPADINNKISYEEILKIVKKC